MGLSPGQNALLIFDVFKGQKTEKYRSLLEMYDIIAAHVPANMTKYFQPLDLTINGVAKTFLKDKFGNWYAREVTRLYIIATYNDNPSILNVTASEYEEISHHFLVDFTVNCVPVAKDYKTISVRDIKNIDPIKFDNDVKEKAWNIHGTFGQKVKQYNDVLTNIMQEHAPLKKKKVKIIQSAPWFDSEYNNLRNLRRKAEKLYKSSKLSVDKDEFVRLLNQTIVLAYTKKRRYYEEKFKDNSSPKTLYAVVNKILDNSPQRILPTSTSDLELANFFMN